MFIGVFAKVSVGEQGWWQLVAQLVVYARCRHNGAERSGARIMEYEE